MHRDTLPSTMAPRFLSMRGLPIMSTSTVDSSEGDLGFVASVKDSKVPMVVAAGHIEGALEDVVFGALASDDSSWRLRATYMKDKTSDSKIQATIVAPTEADPYTYLRIKWFMREIPRYLSPFVHSRDFLVIEAMESLWTSTVSAMATISCKNFITRCFQYSTLGNPSLWHLSGLSQSTDSTRQGPYLYSRLRRPTRRRTCRHCRATQCRNYRRSY